jgi:hypothetical protein
MRNALSRTIPLLFLAAFILVPARPLDTAPADRPRLIILADMGNEPDEEQQMAHMLVNCNEFELEGLIAVTGKYLRKKPRPDLFLKLIDGYAKVVANLRLHADGWPTPERLRAITLPGQPGYGIADTGEGRSSPGSKRILEALRRDDPRPLCIVVNAGSNTLAQALRDARASFPPAEVKTFVSRLRVFENGAQDNSGAWICHEFPAVHWIRSNHQTYAYGGPAFDGGKLRSLGPHTWAPHPYSPDGQHAWAREHIQTGHGALGALYPDRRFGKRLAYLEGGGTIPWLGLVNRGLYDTDQPGWGGWSGRFTAKRQKNVWSRHKDVRKDESRYGEFSVFTEVADAWTDPESGTRYENEFVPVWRWRRAMMNNSRARFDWCVKPRDQANHHPVASLDGDTSDTIVNRTARPGSVLRLDASASSDPDKDPLTFHWYPYPEAGTYAGELTVKDDSKTIASVKIPDDAAGKQIHVILEVRDESPTVALYDYRRVVIDVSEPR